MSFFINLTRPTLPIFLLFLGVADEQRAILSDLAENKHLPYVLPFYATFSLLERILWPPVFPILSSHYHTHAAANRYPLASSSAASGRQDGWHSQGLRCTGLLERGHRW